MSWEKIGITVVGKPTAHGGGLVVRIPKQIVGAYDLWDAEVLEVKVVRAKKPGGSEPSSPGGSEK